MDAMLYSFQSRLISQAKPDWSGGDVERWTLSCNRNVAQGCAKDCEQYLRGTGDLDRRAGFQ